MTEAAIKKFKIFGIVGLVAGAAVFATSFIVNSATKENLEDALETQSASFAAMTQANEKYWA